VVEKEILQIVHPHTSLFNGKTVVDAIEILEDEINGVGLQKPAHFKNVLVVNPNITGCSVATVTRTTLTGTGFKAKVKPFFSYDSHGRHLCFYFLPGLSI
jgi:hypothetical protein